MATMTTICVDGILHQRMILMTTVWDAGQTSIITTRWNAPRSHTFISHFHTGTTGIPSSVPSSS